MIVVDASAVVALLKQEPGYESIAARLLQDRTRYVSPTSSLEAVMALARSYLNPAQMTDRFLQQESIKLLPIDQQQSDWARQAFLTYGKGRHPARLNLGDCFSYAAAKALDAPLLYVGDDFAKTDVRAA